MFFLSVKCIVFYKQPNCISHRFKIVFIRFEHPSVSLAIHTILHTLHNKLHIQLTNYNIPYKTTNTNTYTALAVFIRLLQHKSSIWWRDFQIIFQNNQLHLSATTCLSFARLLSNRPRGVGFEKKNPLLRIFPQFFSSILHAQLTISHIAPLRLMATTPSKLAKYKRIENNYQTKNKTKKYYNWNLNSPRLICIVPDWLVEMYFALCDYSYSRPYSIYYVCIYLS